MVLKGQIPEILPALERVYSLESLNDDFVLFIRVHHLKDLIVKPEFPTAVQLLEQFVSLVSVETALLIDSD